MRLLSTFLKDEVGIINVDPAAQPAIDIGDSLVTNEPTRTRNTIAGTLSSS